MTAITLRSDIQVEFIDSMGDDARVAQAAWISTGPDEREKEEGRVPGLINYLTGHRHGTPFEHTAMTIRAEAPIMVYREWHRHRIQSYNEQSGRYTEFLPQFYVPAPERPLINVGSSARPKMAPAEEHIQNDFRREITASYQQSWDTYQRALQGGIANEMSRLVLPVATYSAMYATANLRAWLHFISLRTSEANAHWQGHPQWEIVQAAKEIEILLEERWPLTLEAFNRHGRVAP